MDGMVERGRPAGTAAARPGMEAVRTTLVETFGHRRLRPAQRPAVRAVLDGRDLLAVLPTGSGKSLCFQLPALLLPGLTLVVSPLVSLMDDQVEKLRSLGIDAAALHSALRRSSRRDVGRALADGRLRLLYVSPERLWSDDFASRLAGARPGRVVVDEAHCISEWGHDFRPAYRRIGAFLRRIGRPPVAAFTATATPRTRADVRSSLGLRDPVEVLAPVDRPNLRYEVTGSADLLTAASRAAEAVRRARGASIVYAGTRRRTERMAAYLRRRGLPAAAYHAGLAAAERSAVQERFLGRELRAVCATTAFGMGVDHAGVRLVCHLGRPASLEGYVQEAGRAGRDGDPARCLLIPLEGDASLHAILRRCSWPRPSSVRRVWNALADGRPLTEAELGRRLRGRVSEPEREGAIRVLALHGLVSLREGGHRSGGRRLEKRTGARLESLDRRGLRRGRRRARRRFRAVVRYARARRCRRAVIAKYFGETSPRCAGCDRCG